MRETFSRSLVLARSRYFFSSLLVEGHYALGIVYWQNGDFAQADSRFAEAVRLSPDYAEAWAMYGTVLRQKGARDEARIALERAIRLKPEDPGPYSQLAQLLRAQGDGDLARKYLEQAAARKAAKESMQREMFDRSAAPKPKVVP